jgi:hypothetical protein
MPGNEEGMKRPLVITMKFSPKGYRYFIEEGNVEIAGPFETIEEARKNLEI